VVKDLFFVKRSLKKRGITNPRRHIS